VKLRSLRVGGFGRLADAEFEFAPGLNVVVGPNEAGKSTLGAAIVASLYGLQRGEKDRWRPWTGAAFATTLRYETADGRGWEVRREYDKDAKGVRVYDADGNDAAARVGNGKSLIPGESHLRISYDVFVQTACVRERAVAFDRGAAEDVSAALARALGGGPKEDAAIGALARLDDALRKHVGTQRAHKNAPLKALREREERERRAAADARATLTGLTALRERIVALREERDRDRAAASELERRSRALRAAHLRARLAALKEYRDELAALQADRAAFDDVAGFPAERVVALNEAYHAWRAAESLAEAASRDAAGEALSDAERGELEQRRRDAGTLDDDALAALRAAAAQAEAARARAAAASHATAAARRESDGGRALSGALVALAIAATLTDVGVAIAHRWVATAVASVIAIALTSAAFSRVRARAARRRDAEAQQRIADAATAEEHAAASTLAGVLEPLGIATVDALVALRERFVALSTREAAAYKAELRAQSAREAADTEGAQFDGLALTLVPGVAGTREELRAAAAARAARRAERDGIEARLAMLAMRRTDILHGEDGFALQAEYDALLAAGVEPAASDDASLHALERERAELDNRAREAERGVASLEGELRRGEEAVPDLAALDESLAATRAAIARLEAFARAIELAKTTIEHRKDEAHRAFARRLEQYSAQVLETITAGRYGEVRLDPASLALSVRVPETGAIESLERLSAGTRDQVALVVRFATARMFAEGLETPPLLLDDPFAFWDAERIARCLPVLIHGAAATQTILFTASTQLAAAATDDGATRIALGGPLVAI
jgi:DNA repair exonuclease SbcCD ATPase subunit